VKAKVVALAVVVMLTGCSALDTADDAWETAVSNHQDCIDAVPPTSLSAEYVAEAPCESAFASALEAITWPNAQLGQEAQAVENHATIAAAALASGGVPAVAQSEQYIADKQTLDDDLARERLAE
jgi:hypothetical protein